MKRNLLRAASLLLAIVIAGCGGADAPAERELAGGPLAQPQAVPRTGPTPPRAPTTLEGLDALRRPLASPKALPNAGYTVDTTSREQVRLFYKSVFASTNGVPSGWTGDVGTCTPGDTTADFKAAVLRRINWYRAMAGVPATVQFDATLNMKAQQVALLQSAHNPDPFNPVGINHFPDASWLCASQLPFAIDGASKSNLGLNTNGVDSIDGYMQEYGSNNFEVGHRRWLLYPQTQLMGTGDVVAPTPTNALWVFDTTFPDPRPRPAVRDQFVAWPAPGYAPYTTVFPRWSFSHPNANFASATVTMHKGPTLISTSKEVVQDGFGENSIVWYPQGQVDRVAWAKPTADETYTVTISNVLKVNPLGVAVPTSFTYTVTVFDPETPGAGDGPITISGSGTATTGQPSGYGFTALPGANSYQWRVLTASAFAGDGAESGAGNFTAVTSTGYNVITSDAHATGSNAFHLAHGTAPGPAVDQVLRLNLELVGTASPRLVFKSRLGLSSPDQRALVEVSADQGATWTVVYEQAGVQTGFATVFGESSFTTKTINLDAFANRIVLVRFRFAFSGGILYAGADPGIGWYIDDISATGMSSVTTAATATTSSPDFTLTAPVAGQKLLQARAGMYGYYADWGLTKAVTVLPPNPSDCLFDWAENALGSGLAAHTSSFTYVDAFYMRMYSSGLILGVSLVDIGSLGIVKDNVYWALDGQIHDIGPKGGWYDTASCAH